MFGVAMTAWLRFMYNNPMAEITLTVLTAYATYLVGDRLFGVSGVLAVVVLGAMLEPSTAHAHALRIADIRGRPPQGVRLAGHCQHGCLAHSLESCPRMQFGHMQIFCCEDRVRRQAHHRCK